MSCEDPLVWMGMAEEYAKGKTSKVPAYVQMYCHKKCRRPTKAWNLLVNLQREHQALLDGTRRPVDVLGNNTVRIDHALTYLEQQSFFWARDLALGTVTRT